MVENEKQRISLYLDKKLVKEGDGLMKEMGCKSRNELYTRLLEERLACDFLTNHETVLVSQMERAVAAMSEKNAKAVSKGLFRYAVQLEMALRMLSQDRRYDALELEQLRLKAIQSVRATSGKVSLEDIMNGRY